MDRSTKQKISKETQVLNDTMDQLELIDIYRACHPKTMEFTFFSSVHGTFSRIDHIRGHKYSLGKIKKKKNWNHLNHLFWPPVSKISCQLQEKKKKNKRKLLKIQTYGGWKTRFWITNRSWKNSKRKWKSA